MREFHAMLETQAEKRMSRIARSMTYAERVREVLLERPEVHQSRSMNAVARVLGLSVRSLRRRLTDEGVSFQQVTRRRRGASDDLCVTAALTLQAQ